MKNHICLGIVTLSLSIILIWLGLHMDSLIDVNKQLRAEASTNELVIESLEQMCRLQGDEIEWMEEELQEANDAWQESNDILIGRIEKITSAFHIRERELLDDLQYVHYFWTKTTNDLRDEIERLEKQLEVCEPCPPLLDPPPLPPTCRPSPK